MAVCLAGQRHARTGLGGRRHADADKTRPPSSSTAGFCRCEDVGKFLVEVEEYPFFLCYRPLCITAWRRPLVFQRMMPNAMLAWLHCPS
uniref:Uncharacterized protein n=1 Tax=Oryza rufipogon TaxID=4529 RepID=A0A0E0N141_ORYRU